VIESESLANGAGRRSTLDRASYLIDLFHVIGLGEIERALPGRREVSAPRSREVRKRKLALAHSLISLHTGRCHEG